MNPFCSSFRVFFIWLHSALVQMSHFGLLAAGWSSQNRRLQRAEVILTFSVVLNCKLLLAHDKMSCKCVFAVLQEYILSIDGGNPMIKWQLEKGLDWTLSSVAGESYRVEVSTALVFSFRAAGENYIQSLIKPFPHFR